MNALRRWDTNERNYGIMNKDAAQYAGDISTVGGKIRRMLVALVFLLAGHVRGIAMVAGIGFGISALATATLLGRIQLAVVLTSVSIGFFIYLFTRQNTSTKLTLRDLNPRYLHLGYGFVYIVAVLVLVADGIPIFRPPLFFALSTLLFVLPAVEVFLRRKITTFAVVGTLTKVALAKLLYLWSLFAGIHSTGGDVTNHVLHTTTLVDFGRISAMTGYSEVPFFHLLWANISLILGIDILAARTGIFVVSAIGILFVYLLAKNVTGSKPGALYGAIVFSTFTLTNRVKLQTEALVFPVFFTLILFLVYRDGSETRDFVLLQVLFLGLLLSHFYYSNLLVQYVVIVAALAVVFKPMVDPWVSTRYLTHLLAFVGIFWTVRITFSSRFDMTVTSLIEVVRASLTGQGSLSVQPSFLTPKITHQQFVLLHLAEFAVLSLSVVAILVFVDRFDPSDRLKMRRLFFGGTFAIFSTWTVLFIIVEGQRRLAWGVSFRSVYLLGILMCVLAGFGIAQLTRAMADRRKALVALVLVVMVVSGGSLVSQQTQRIDPSVYAGDVQSPRAYTTGQADTQAKFYRYVPSQSTVLGDQLMTRSAKVRFALYQSGLDLTVQRQFFELPSLDKLNNEYDYLVLNEYARERGMLLKGATGGVNHNRERLHWETTNNHLIWDTGQTTIYRNRSA